jgi:hypothetical protein
VHLNPVWIVPLAAGGAGAGVLAVAAGVLRREVRRLQQSMRPLRVPRRDHRR